MSVSSNQLLDWEDHTPGDWRHDLRPKQINVNSFMATITETPIKKQICGAQGIQGTAANLVEIFTFKILITLIL